MGELSHAWLAVLDEMGRRVAEDGHCVLSSMETLMLGCILDQARTIGAFASDDEEITVRHLYKGETA